MEPRNFDPEERMDLLLKHLGNRHEGLSVREAVRRLEQYGPNEIRHREGGGHLGVFVRRFTYPLALLLWAALLTFVGDAAPLGVAIMAVIFLNAVFAFVQELQAEKSTKALKRHLPSRARVRRGAGWSRWRRPSRLAPAVRRCSRSASSRTGCSSGGSTSNWPSAATVIYLPPLQASFGTNALGLRELTILAVFPFLVWGSDELSRWALQRRELADRVARGDGSRIPKRGER